MKSSVAAELKDIINELKKYLTQQIELGTNELFMPSQKIINNKTRKLKILYESVKNCRRCSLYRTRKNIVFGSGSTDASLVFIGEAPGEEEDIEGLPFVGRAGQLLTKIIQSVHLTREEVYITNILKCRPPGNRNPLPEEIKQCEPYLIEQLNILQPKLICALGLYAAQTLLKTKSSISTLRGKIHWYNQIKVLPTYHPAALLRNPQLKKATYEDMKLVVKEYKNI